MERGVEVDMSDRRVSAELRWVVSEEDAEEALLGRSEPSPESFGALRTPGLDWRLKLGRLEGGTVRTLRFSLTPEAVDGAEPGEDACLPADVLFDVGWRAQMQRRKVFRWVSGKLAGTEPLLEFPCAKPKTLIVFVRVHWERAEWMEPKKVDGPVESPFHRFLFCEALEDVRLRVAGRAIPAHRAVLAAHSPVFAALFSHTDFREAETRVVELEDVAEDPAVAYASVRRFLAFVYSGVLTLGAGEREAEEGAEMEACLGALRLLAERYEVSALAEAVEWELVRGLDEESICGTAQLGLLLGSRRLLRAASFAVRQADVRLDEAQLGRLLHDSPDLHRLLSHATRPALSAPQPSPDLAFVPEHIPEDPSNISPTRTSLT